MTSVTRSWAGTVTTISDSNPDPFPEVRSTFRYTGQYSDTVSYGGNIKDWRKRLKSGLACTTSLSGDYRSIKSSGSAKIRVKRINKFSSDVWDVSGMEGGPCWQFFAPCAQSSLSLTTANNAALSGFVKRCDQLISAFQGFTFLGELRETLQMIRHPMRGLFGEMGKHVTRAGKLRRRFRESNRSLHSRVSDLWLERAFGWNPLCQDIDNGMNALSLLGSKRPPNQRVSYGSIEKKFLTPVSFSVNNGFSTIDILRKAQDVASVKYHGLVVLDWNEYSNGFTHFGFRMDSILPAMWELIPYSFLVDYFTNIGDIILASSFAASRLAWVEKGTSNLREEVMMSSFNLPTDTSTYRYETNSSVCNHEIRQRNVSVARIDYTGQSLVPSLEFQIPGLSMKWLNILALGQQHRSALRRVYG